MVTLKDIQKAHDRIKGLVNRTPVMTSRTLDDIVNTKAFLKCENYQRAGAFKMRGACNFLTQLTEEEKERGVIAYSSGNHAQAVALASKLLGIKATIVMPDKAPRVKAEATKGYGADVVWADNEPMARRKQAEALAKEKGLTMVPPFDHERIIAGAGTASLELIDEVGIIDHLFCPIGGGGLISGQSIAVKGLCPKARVIGVEPEVADDAFRGLRDGKIYPSGDPKTIADGLRTPLCELTFSIMQEKVDEIVLVSDEEIVDAMRFLWERMKMVVEPSGAASIAALFKFSKEHDLAGKKVGVIISGGNVDLGEFFDDYHKRIE